MASSPVTVAVVIPVYNGGVKFRATLDSVRSAVPAADEVIVIGDGDTDGSSAYAESSGVMVYRFPEPGGPARARNLGAAKATSDILFFVDADVTVPADIIGQVRDILHEDSRATAVIGSYDDEPGERNFLSQYRNMLHHYVHQNGSEEASTFWGACGAIHRDVFLQAGGFDETYAIPSIEDIELGYRLRRAGHSIRLAKSLQVKHWKRWNLISMVKADVFQRALPWTALIYRDRNLVNDLNIGFSGRVSVCLMFGLVGTLAGALWNPMFLAAGSVMAFALLVINSRFYRWLSRKRGVGFALQAMPWHWLYFLYSGIAFAIGTARHFLNRHSSSPRKPALRGSPEPPTPVTGVEDPR